MDKLKRILLDVSIHQTRIALVEDGELLELIYENKRKESIIGNIYMGRVENVLPGMQAAFIDIGAGRNAYYFYGQPSAKDNSAISTRPRVGDELLVQVEKAASGSKGAFVTTKISFPGKFLVLLPDDQEMGISKKITEKRERQRMKEIAMELLPENYGIIIRTEGKGKSSEDYKQEIQRLLKISTNLKKQARFHKAPALLHKEQSSEFIALRELFSEDIDEFIVNDASIYAMLRESIGEDHNESLDRLKLYEEKIPIFERYSIESQIEKAFSKKVWLKSGGFLIIEQTEACVVIDVNTGKYTGKKDLQTTILKTNLEAATEIAKQLRLRNLSGMIIVDFIDMKKSENKEELKRFLEKAVSTDRMKTVVVGLTELGLMQMTRKKARPSIFAQMTSLCQCCDGSGRVPTLESLVTEIRRKVVSIFVQTIFDEVTIKADSRLLAAFSGEKNEFKIALEKTYGKTIILEAVDQMIYGKYEIERRKK